MTRNPLVRIRTLLGVTQEAMADAIGISLRTYQRREALGDMYDDIPFREIAAASTIAHATLDEAIYGRVGDEESGEFFINWMEEADDD